MTFTFFLIRWTPGSPVDRILGEKASLASKQKLASQMGLDQPILKQYFIFLKKALVFDFGYSVFDEKPAWDHFKKAFLPTVALALSALLISALWGVVVGIFSAIYKNSFFDHIINTLCMVGISLPVYFTAPVLVWFLGVYIPWLPISGMGGAAYYILPSISLTIPLGSALCQMSRASLLEILNQDYIRTAKAKGLSAFQIYFKHALKLAVIPVITIFSLQTSALLTGMVITETIFDWPGIGLLLFQSITRRDYPVVQVCIIWMAVIYLLVQFLADLAYSFFQPDMKVF